MQRGKRDGSGCAAIAVATLIAFGGFVYGAQLIVKAVAWAIGAAESFL